MATKYLVSENKTKSNNLITMKYDYTVVRIVATNTRQWWCTPLVPKGPAFGRQRQRQADLVS